MHAFKEYSLYYDLLYNDKNYLKEVDFVDKLLKKYGNDVVSLLELGSGTGKHAQALTQKGYKLLCLDQSETMLSLAQQLLAQTPELSNKIEFKKSDIRYLDLDGYPKFDSAISLFHVMSYQTTQADLEGVFEGIKKYVKPAGLFIFDCWYGPAVLNDAPQVRFKSLEKEGLKVERVAVPQLHENENIVEVNYHIFIKEKEANQYTKIEELHKMRYLFLAEVADLCAKFEMKIEMSCEWLTEQPLSKDTWGACFVIRV